MTYAHERLLPPGATPLELSLAEVDDPLVALMDAFASIPSADNVPAPNLLPFLVWEYGLGELSPYLPNLHDLISEGVRWQRMRGTPASVARAIGWLGYAGSLEYEPPRHRRWNRFQLALDRVRDADQPDLLRIEGVTQLSAPVRSQFVRGFHGYDVRAAETSYQRTSGSIIGDASGVRVGSGAAKWSFGRDHEIEHVLTHAELAALGTWLEPIVSDYWVSNTSLWVDAHYLWATPGVQARRNSIIAALTGSPVYVAFRAADGSLIGHARATARSVAAAPSGEYVFAGAALTTATTVPHDLLVWARTGFGDGFGHVAATASLVFGPTRSEGIGPGLSWVPPGGLSGGVEVASASVSIPFGLAVREHVQILLGLDGPY